MALGVWLTADPTQKVLFPFFAFLALMFGVLLILPIGAVDMPTVISLLNSYAGLSASAMGFVLMDKTLMLFGDATSFVGEIVKELST